MAEERMTRRQFLKGAAVAASGAVLAACAAPATPKPAVEAKEEVPSEVFRYAFDNETETRKPAVEKFFELNYPNMKPEFEVTPQGYWERLLAQIAAGDPPDIAYVHERALQTSPHRGRCCRSMTTWPRNL